MIKLPELFRPQNHKSSPKSSLCTISLEDPSTQRIFAHIPIAVGVLTQDGKVLSTNGEFLRSVRVLREDIRTMFFVSSEAEVFLAKMPNCQSRSTPLSLGTYSCFQASRPEEDYAVNDSQLFEWSASFDVPSGLYVITAM